MQTLGLSDSTPRSESRLQSLFWPSISTAADVDYIGAQGFWICAIVAVLTLLSLCAMAQPILGVLFFAFFFIGGIGVRERSLYAAVMVFLLYLLNAIASGVTIFETSGIVRMLVVALLLANVRATIIATTWSPGSEEANLPVRLNSTWGDKFADQLPTWVWPKIRIVYYVYSALLMSILLLGWMIIIVRHSRIAN